MHRQPEAGWKQAALMIGACLALIATGVIVSLALEPGERGGPVLGNLSGAEIVEIRDANGQAVLHGEFRSRQDAVGNTEKDAALYDRRGRSVIGEVEIEIPASDRSVRRVELEVDIIGLPPRQTFYVVIDDRPVWRFETDDRGSVDREMQEGER